MNDATAGTQTLAETEPPHEGWSRQRWIFVIAVVLAAHVALIFIFGTKKPIKPRAAVNVPQLQLADNSSDLIALGDPTLFALPHANDFGSAIWLKNPVITPPVFRYTEAPRVFQKPDSKNLGATFQQLMHTNRFTKFELNFKPEPQLPAPIALIESTLPQNSTLIIVGKLAQRLLNPIKLPSLPYTDVIAPSRIQVLVNAAGDVISAVSLPSDDPSEAVGHWDVADQDALTFARTLRFAPASKMTFGKLIFKWHTIPEISTNAPSKL